MKFDNNVLPGNQNFYLTTNNNTAMIQTGHSNCEATADEQKILSNLIFYLADLGREDTYIDNNFKDINKPNLPTKTSNNVIGINGTVEYLATDNGTTYKYYIEATEKLEQTVSTSNTVTKTNLSGISGYSYVIDTNPNTSVDNTIDTTSTSINYTLGDGPNTYLHIKAVDGAGNVGETLHVLLHENIAPELSLSQDITKWTNGNVIISATSSDSDGRVVSVKLPNGNVVTGDKATYEVETNGTYEFSVTDNSGATTKKSITITNIDKVKPEATSSIAQPTPEVRGATITLNATDDASGVAKIIKPDGTEVTNATTTYVVTIPETYTFKVIDVAGNEKDIDVPVVIVSDGVDVKYIDQVTKEEINTTIKLTGNVGQSYETVAKPIEGYELVKSPENVNGKMTIEKLEVVYEYRKNSYVTTKYINEVNGDELSEQNKQKYKQGDEYTTIKENIAEYTFTRVEGDSAGTVAREDITVIYYYKKNTSVTVKYLDKYATDVVLADEVTKTGLETDNYTTEQIIVSGYVFSNVEGTANGKMQATPTNITYYYIKESNVVTKYVDENTGLEISGVDSITTTYKEKDPYTTEKKTIEGYTYTRDTENISGIVGRENIEVTYYYKKNSGVTVKYIDKNTNQEIATSETITGLEGAEYTAEQKQVEGYVFDSVEGDKNGNIPSTAITVTYKYVKQSNVVTKYVDENTGSEILGVDSITTTYKEKDNYTTEKKTINGYTYTRDTENISGTVGRENIEVIYYYKKNTSVTVKYLDKYATDVVVADEVTKTGLEADEYTTEQKTVSGYVYDSVDGQANGKMQDTPTTVTYYYIKESNVVTKYVDENTGLEISGVDSITTTYKEKDNYTTEKKTINGYTYTRDTENTSGIVERKDITVTYFYKKNTSVTVKYVDMLDNNKEIAERVVIPGLENQDYETEEKEIAGYIFVEKEGIVNGKMSQEPTEVIYKYKKSSNLITEHIDANTKEKIIEDVVKTYKEGDNYEALAQNFEGYVLVQSPGSTTGVMGRDNITKTFYYKKISGGLVVKYTDRITGELLDQKEYTGNENDSITLEEKTFLGYVLDERPDYNNIELGVEGKEVIFYYRKTVEINVIGIDQETGDEIYSTSVSGVEGNTYTTNGKEVEGYVLVKTPENTTGIFNRSNTNVIYEYRKIGEVKVRYIDRETNEELDNYIINGKSGDNYITEEKEFENYDLVEVVGEYAGIIKRESTEVIYYYELKTGKVIIRYVDERGNELLKEEQIGKVGSEYQTEIKGIENYEVIEVTNNSEGKYVDGTIEVEIKYRKLKGKIVVKFVDSYGNVLSENYVEQDEIEKEFYYELPEIEGYRIVGDKIIKAIFSNGELVFNAEYEKIIEELPNTGDINVVFYILIATFSIIIITKKII